MKIGVFAYNFHHWKTQSGIINLILSDKKPDIIFAANKVDLNFYKSKIRTSPKDLFLHHPKKIAQHYGIEYRVARHNSEEVRDEIIKKELDLGIILGARILKPIAFSSFKTGVLNMHPGILPENRGLDTIKWAIINKIDQGVTSHLIDEKIDRGRIIDTDTIKIYKDDTLVDIQIRIQNLEQKMMLDAIEMLETETNVKQLTKAERGHYNRSMPPHIEQDLIKNFKEYKSIFGVKQ